MNGFAWFLAGVAVVGIPMAISFRIVQREAQLLETRMLTRMQPPPHPPAEWHRGDV